MKDHGPGIWSHYAWDRNQQCFSRNQGSGKQRKWIQESKFSSFLGSGINILGKNMESVRKKNIPRYDPVIYLETCRVELNHFGKKTKEMMLKVINNSLLSMGGDYSGGNPSNKEMSE